MLRFAHNTVRAVKPSLVRQLGTIPAIKFWKKDNFDVSKVQVSVPDDSASELREWTLNMLRSGVDIDAITVKPEDLPHTANFVRGLEEEYLVNGPGVAVSRPIPNLSENIQQMRLASLAMTGCMGEALVQNSQQQRSILVFDRDSSRRMTDGQRYHQSREGGSLHTDNVNVPDTWEYMLLTCLQPAVEGGESLLVSGFTLLDYLKEHSPEAVETLQEDFLFEFRGFDERFYKAPILFFNKLGQPCFRWLREYIESAHSRAGEPLTQKQLDALNALTEASLKDELRVEYRFRQGEVLFANDMQILHGRTQFSDKAPSKSEYDFSNPVNRLFQRNWLHTYQPDYRGMNQSRYAIM